LPAIGPTQHVFVFTHYPMPNNTTVWPTLKAMLPRNRSTIFTGHLHFAELRRLDGILLRARLDRRRQRMAAWALSICSPMSPLIAERRPSVSSHCQIKPASYAPAVVALRDVMRGSAFRA